MTPWRQLSLLEDLRWQRSTRPPALEFKTQCALADAMRRGVSPGWLWNHFPAGEKRTEGAGARLKRMGLQPGWGDLVLIGPDGVHHWLELKRGRAPLTEAQQRFGVAMLERGVPYRVARSFNEAIAILTDWGAIRLRISA